MSKVIENLKSGNYEVVDNQGVSVTTHFIECLEKELVDLEAKLAESEVIIKGGKEEIKDLHRKINEIVERDMNCIQQLKQQLAEERKKVVQKIKDEIKKLKKSAPKHDIGYDCDDVLLSNLEISEILDQIERNYV